ncbi:protein BEX4-like [Castor canadensis]|uniref:Protein BEX4-like n=1 Tax=Castor canadensis TaxID=51338 RepID=A0AC58K1Z5_CASCN
MLNCQQTLRTFSDPCYHAECITSGSTRSRGRESHHLGGAEGQKPGGNVKLGRVRRLVPNFGWGISSRHIDRNEVGDDVEKFVGQMMEIKRKSREQQMRHYRCFQTSEPDNHYDFCLIP